MSMAKHSETAAFELPGITHRTLAGPPHGMRTLEVWMQTLAPGAATPTHRHACEEVIVVLDGRGECNIEQQTIPFEAGSTLIIPVASAHRITNTGDTDMHLIVAMGASPVRVRDADGELLPLPWDPLQPPRHAREMRHAHAH